MTTKAEQFDAETQRAARAKKKKAISHQSAGLRAKKRGRTKDRFPNPTSHNEAPRLAKTSAYELEAGQSVRPSRKSTRRSPTHQKTDAVLRNAVVARNTSPRNRATRSPGK